ncbi:MAG: Rab family GTPase [Candidatus Hodarchaeales archaeon]|jgi:small GTP-binding protein
MSLKKTKRILKLILIGDPGVGKTSLIQQFVHSKFKHSYQVTIGLDVSSKDVELEGPNGSEMARLSIHDIGGQDRFVTIRHLFYPGAHLAMLVYDVTRPQSLKNLETVWIKELEQYNPPKDSNVQVEKVLVGNKADLEDLRSISQEEGDDAAKLMGCTTHILASAKENKNVDESFKSLAEVFLKKAGVH